MRLFYLFCWLRVSLYFPQVYAQSLKDDYTSFSMDITRLLNYPLLARNEQKVGQTYVHFKIEPTGKVTDVSILNPNGLDSIFQQAITRAWDQLPTQKRQNKGDYLILVNFRIQNKAKNQLKQAKPILFDRKKFSHSTILYDYVLTAYL